VEVYLDYGDTLLPHLEGTTVQDCENEELEGWVWTEPGTSFIACKASCDQIQASYGLDMRIIYPCE
jgi:hypothetical protein